MFNNKLTIEDISKLFYAELNNNGIISFTYTPDGVEGYAIGTNKSVMIISWILSDKECYRQMFTLDLFNKYINLDVSEIVEEFIKPTVFKFKAIKKLHDNKRT